MSTTVPESAASRATVAEKREFWTQILRDLANVSDADRYDFTYTAVDNHDTGYKITVGMPRSTAGQILAILIESDKYTFEHAQDADPLSPPVNILRHFRRVVGQGGAARDQAGASGSQDSVPDPVETAIPNPVDNSTTDQTPQPGTDPEPRRSIRLLARQQKPAESVEAARQAGRAAMDTTQVGRALVVGQAGMHAATGRQQHGAGEDGATENITVRGSTLPTPPQNSPPPPLRTAAQFRAAFNRMAAVEDTSEFSRIHRVSAASRRSPHSLSSVARHPTVGHALLAAAAPLPARARPEDRAAAAPQDRPTLNTNHDDVNGRVCDRIERLFRPPVKTRELKLSSVNVQTVFHLPGGSQTSTTRPPLEFPTRALTVLE
jgi:hypothetical protein